MSQTAATLPSSKSRVRRDVRPLAIGGLLVLVALVALLVNWIPGREIPELQPLPAEPAHKVYQPFDTRHAAPERSEEWVWKAPEPVADPHDDPEGHMRQAKLEEARGRFEQATVMLHAKRYDEAIVALNRVLVLIPTSADAYTNLGYALIGREEFEAAYDTFDRAIDLNPAQANAYYGAAIAQEGMGNLEVALGGMRSFLHLTDKGPGHIHAARARSAIWEWEARLGRGPWGPTRGIPPGFTEEELQRDGKGVGIKIPRPETADENGLMQYEIRSQEKTELFER